MFIDTFESSLNAGDIREEYNKMRDRKKEIQNMILKEFERIDAYKFHLDSINVFECEDCGREICCSEYMSNNNVCDDCGEKY